MSHKIKLAPEVRIKLLERKVRGYEAEGHAVEQVAGKALGYPYFCDDPGTFPGATPEDGVCVAPHTPTTIVEELASRYETVTELLQLIAGAMLDNLEHGRELTRNEKGLVIIGCERLGLPPIRKQG